MEVDEDEFEVPSSSSKGEKKRFEVKKVNTINLFICKLFFLLKKTQNGEFAKTWRVTNFSLMLFCTSSGMP